MVQALGRRCFTAAMTAGCLLLFTLFAAPARAQDDLQSWAVSRGHQLEQQLSGRAARPADPPRFHPTLDIAQLVRAFPFLAPQTREALAPVARFTREAEGFSVFYPHAKTAAAAGETLVTLTTSHFLIRQYRTGQSTEELALATTAQVLEEVYAYEVQSPRWLQFDSPLQKKKPYEVTLRNLPEGYYGLTYPNRCDEDGCGSFIEIDDNFSFLFNGADTEAERNKKLTEAIQVTLAHEFFHAVQFKGYRILTVSNEQSVRLSTWFIEGSAVWMEDFVYPAVNDYTRVYTAPFLANPQDSLTGGPTSANPLQPYGTVLWFKEVTDNRGVGVVRNLFEYWKEQSSKGVDAEVFEENLNSTVFGVLTTMWEYLLAQSQADGGLIGKPRARFKVKSAPFQESVSLPKLGSYLLEIDLDWLRSMALEEPESQLEICMEGLSGDASEALLVLDEQNRLAHLWLGSGTDTGRCWNTVELSFGSISLSRAKGLWLLGVSKRSDVFTVTVKKKQATTNLPQATARIPLRRGWNLVSVATAPPRGVPQDYFTSADAVWFPQSTETGLQFLQEDNSTFPLMDTPGRVYLIHQSSPNPVSVGVTGTFLPGRMQEVRLLPGYNAVGNPGLADLSLKALAKVEQENGQRILLKDLPPGWLGEDLYVLNADTQQYESAPDWTLKPGQAGWLVARRPMTLLIPVLPSTSGE